MLLIIVIILLSLMIMIFSKKRVVIPRIIIISNNCAQALARAAIIGGCFGQTVKTVVNVQKMVFCYPFVARDLKRDKRFSLPLPLGREAHLAPLRKS